jgi:hypothetical protein
MYEIQDSKNKLYFENKISRHIYFKNPLLAIYRENKSGADYVQGEENREAQLKIIKTTFTNLVVRTMCS